MPSKDRSVANKTKAEFKKRAHRETFSDSAVDQSLDRMAGSSQEIVKDAGKVRESSAARRKN
jgi:hypothetical protein